METVVWSKPEHERAGTPLLVMLHGYGTDESRMAKLFGSLPPEFTCAALRGPKVIGDDYGWFLLDYFLTHDFADVITSTNAVFGWIDSVKDRHSSVSLLGFSQGMAMASTLLRLRPAQFRAVVGLSGFVLDNELLAMSESFDLPAAVLLGPGQGRRRHQRRRHRTHRGVAAPEHRSSRPGPTPAWAIRSRRPNLWTSARSCATTSCADRADPALAGRSPALTGHLPGADKPLTEA